MSRKFRNRLFHLFPVVRAIGVIAAVMIIISGVTFANLQTPQIKLTGNNIQTATAALQISLDGVAYAANQPGFAFSNVVPGGLAVPANGYQVFVKNTGGAPLALKLAVSSTPTNLDVVDLTKVHVILAPTAGGSVQNFTLQSLIASSGGQAILSPAQLAAGASASYKLQVTMDNDAVSGPSATIGNIDFSFTGTAITP